MSFQKSLAKTDRRLCHCSMPYSRAVDRFIKYINSSRECLTPKGAKIGPGFLIHDSHLFDGVDERQVAKALQIGAELAEKFGFQYIVTMNSDAVPKEGFGEGFNLEKYILPVQLTDEDETGGLFGVRF